VTRAQATRPVVPPPKPPPDAGGQANPDTRALQQRFADLGFLALSAVDGVAGEETRFAVIAFQKWERLARDGIAGPQTRAALARAGRPSPITSGGGGRRVEVLLDRQLTLAIENNAVVRAIPRLDRGARLRDAGGPLLGVPKGGPVVLGAVQGLAALGELLRRRRGIPRVSRCSRHAGLARVRPDASVRRQLALRLHAGTPVSVLARS